MRKFFTILFLMGLIAAGVGLVFFLRPGKVSQPRAPAPPSFFLELTEENKDTFPELLALFSAKPLAEPFWYRDGKIEMDPGLAQAVSKGEARERYGLREHPSRLDLSKPLLFVEHQINFLGVGREWGTSRYFIFEKLPAAIPLEPYPETSKEVRLPLLNSLDKLAQVRLVGGSFEISKSPSGAPEDTGLQIHYQDKIQSLKPGGELLVGEETKTLRVLQEYTAPVPLGPVKPDQIRTETEDRGEIHFSTTLRARLEKPAPASVWMEKKE